MKNINITYEVVKEELLLVASSGNNKFLLGINVDTLEEVYFTPLTLENKKLYLKLLHKKFKEEEAYIEVSRLLEECKE